MTNIPRPSFRRKKRTRGTLKSSSLQRIVKSKISSRRLNRSFSSFIGTKIIVKYPNKWSTSSSLTDSVVSGLSLWAITYSLLVPIKTQQESKCSNWMTVKKLWLSRATVEWFTQWQPTPTHHKERKSIWLQQAQTILPESGEYHKLLVSIMTRRKASNT